MAWDSAPSAIHLIDTALPFDFGDPVRAEREALAMLRLAQESGEVARAAEIRTQVARAELLQGKVWDAECTLYAVSKLLAAIDDPIVPLRYGLEMGRVLAEKRMTFDAAARITAVWEQACRHRAEFFAIDAAQMMSVISSPKVRLPWLERALEIAERSTDGRVGRWRGPLLNAVGLHLVERGELERAQATLTRAVEILEADGTQAMLVEARRGLAKVHHARGNTTQATAMLESLVVELSRTRARDGLVEEALAECLLSSGHADKARPYFALAHEALSGREWLRDNQPGRLARMEKLSRTHH